MDIRYEVHPTCCGVMVRRITWRRQLSHNRRLTIVVRNNDPRNGNGEVMVEDILPEAPREADLLSRIDDWIDAGISGGALARLDSHLGFAGPLGARRSRSKRKYPRALDLPPSLSSGRMRGRS